MGPARFQRILAAALLLASVSAACGEAEPTVEGIVVSIDGDLTTVRTFRMRTTDGRTLDFVPAPGIAFHGMAPLSHLSDHVISGESIVVTYEELSDGTLVATMVGDADE